MVFATNRFCLPKNWGMVIGMEQQAQPGEPDLARFGAIVKARRAALGLTQEEVNALGGPSDTTFTKIENLEWRPGRPATLRKLDDGLKWQPGSSASILYRGGQPEPIDVTDAEPPTTTDGRSDAEVAGELAVTMDSTLTNVWKVLSQLDASRPDVAQALANLDASAHLAELLIVRVVRNGEDLARLKKESRSRLRLAQHEQASEVPAKASPAETPESAIRHDDSLSPRKRSILLELVGAIREAPSDLIIPTFVAGAHPAPSPEDYDQMSGQEGDAESPSM